MHICRWERCDISHRELCAITDNPNPSLLLSTNSEIGTTYQSTILLRCITLMLITLKSNSIKKQCKTLHSSRTVDEEVVEVVKRRHVVRLNEDRQGLGALIGLSFDPLGDRIYDVPPLIAVMQIHGITQVLLFKNKWHRFCL